MARPKKIFSDSFRAKAQDYFVQVSLILLSLFIAVGVDRCNTVNKQEEKLEEYFQAIARDLAEEEATNRMNLIDCEKDIADLEQALSLFRHAQTDSLDAGLQKLGRVMTRGVFRTFSPTTFDVMAGTGDILLIKDLQLRNELTGVFSFRSKILEKDLLQYDQQLEQTLDKLSRYIDYSCFAQNADFTRCLLDKTAFVQDPHNELVVLQRTAQTRAFHLSIAVRHNRTMITVLDSLLQSDHVY